jgi:hypothetical protein
MKKVILALFALVTVLAISPVASAQTYDFTFTGISGPDASLSGSGTLVVGADGVVTSLIGTFDGSPMSLLPVNGYASNDNVFNTSGTPSYFDFDGLSFSFTANSTDFNLTYLNGVTAMNDSSDDPGGYGYDPTTISFSATQVPEGGSSLLYLLLAGVGCFGAMFLSPRNRLGSRASA